MSDQDLVAPPFVVFEVEKLRYMHRNAVVRGLVLRPEQWRWSSCRHYAYGETGVVMINEEQKAELRVRPAAVVPTLRKPRRVGNPISGRKKGGPAHDAKNCLIAMFTAYFDDSGTDANSDIAIAACYISTKRGWDEFVQSWDDARWEEGFDCFHMSDFMAPAAQGKKPWCDWDNPKKTHVYTRLANIINANVRTAIAVAVPKDHWDTTPEWIRGHFGKQHYTFAVRMCMNAIRRWRNRSLITLPLRYIFDWEMQHSEKRIEITKVLDLITEPRNQRVADMLGLEPQGYSFEHKEFFKPLQAADILAWQMRSHMRKIWPLSQDDPKLCHPGFRLLREDQNVDLGFFTKDQLHKFVADVGKLRDEGEPLPTLYRV